MRRIVPIGSWNPKSRFSKTQARRSPWETNLCNIPSITLEFPRCRKNVRTEWGLKVGIAESEVLCYSSAQPMISVALGMAWVAAVLIFFAFVIRDR